MVKQLGATHVYNHRDKNHGELINKEVGSVNVIIEMAADHNLESDLDIIAEHGKIVVIGGPGTATISPSKLLHKQCTVTGVIIMKATPEEYKTMGVKIVEGLKNGTFASRIGQTWPLGDARKAHEAQEKSVHGGGATGKFILLND